MERGQPQAAVTTFVLPNDEMQRTRHGNAASLAADLGVRRTSEGPVSMTPILVNLLFAASTHGSGTICLFRREDGGCVSE